MKLFFSHLQKSKKKKKTSKERRQRKHTKCYPPAYRQLTSFSSTGDGRVNSITNIKIIYWNLLLIATSVVVLFTVMDNIEEQWHHAVVSTCCEEAWEWEQMIRNVNRDIGYDESAVGESGPVLVPPPSPSNRIATKLCPQGIGVPSRTVGHLLGKWLLFTGVPCALSLQQVYSASEVSEQIVFEELKVPVQSPSVYLPPAESSPAPTPQIKLRVQTAMSPEKRVEAFIKQQQEFVMQRTSSPLVLPRARAKINGKSKVTRDSNGKLMFIDARSVGSDIPSTALVVLAVAVGSYPAGFSCELNVAESPPPQLKSLHKQRSPNVRNTDTPLRTPLFEPSKANPSNLVARPRSGFLTSKRHGDEIMAALGNVALNKMTARSTGNNFSSIGVREDSKQKKSNSLQRTLRALHEHGEDETSNHQRYRFIQEKRMKNEYARRHLLPTTKFINDRKGLPLQDSYRRLSSLLEAKESHDVQVARERKDRENRSFLRFQFKLHSNMATNRITGQDPLRNATTPGCTTHVTKKFSDTRWGFELKKSNKKILAAASFKTSDSSPQQGTAVLEQQPPQECFLPPFFRPDSRNRKRFPSRESTPLVTYWDRYNEYAVNIKNSSVLMKVPKEQILSKRSPIRKRARSPLDYRQQITARSGI